MNCISRRDYDKIKNYQTRDALARNLAIKLQYMATSESDRKKNKYKRYPKDILQNAFGEYWYKRPWNELIRLVKALPSCDTGQWTRLSFTNCEYLEAMKDIKEYYAATGCDTIERKVRRTFGKEEGRRFLAAINWCRTMQDRRKLLSRSVMGYRMMRQFDSKLANNIKKNCLAAKASSDFYYTVTEDLNDKSLRFFPAHLRDDFRNICKKYEMRDYARRYNKGSNSYCGGLDTVLKNEIDRILRHNRDIEYSSCYEQRENRIAANINRIATLYRDKEICEALEELGVYDDTFNVCGATKLNTKFVTMVRAVLKSKTDDATKRKVIVELADNIREQNYDFNKVGYTPNLTNIK